LPLQTVGEELTQHSASLLHQPAEAVHAVLPPLAAIVASVAPVVFPQTLAPVVLELSLVSVPVLPAVAPLSLFLALVELSFVALSVGQFKDTPAMFEVVQPWAFVDVAVFVVVDAFAALVVAEEAGE
jgi:hypothetical protein